MIRIGPVDGEDLGAASGCSEEDEPPVGRNGGRDLRPKKSIVACQQLRLAAAIGADPHDAIVAAGH